jgi:predicted ester cyclase
VSAVKTVKTLMTALQSGDMELAASILADDFAISGLLPRPLEKGEFVAMQSELLAGMPDFSYNLEDVHREGEEVRALIQITGTHTNDLSLALLGLQTIPATGLAIDLPQVPVVYQVEDGKVIGAQIELVPGGSLSGLLQQVGAELPL